MVVLHWGLLSPTPAHLRAFGRARTGLGSALCPMPPVLCASSARKNVGRLTLLFCSVGGDYCCEHNFSLQQDP